MAIPVEERPEAGRVVLGFFAVDTARNAPETFSAMAGMAVLAVVLDLVWKRVRDRSGPAPAVAGTGPLPGPNGH